MQALYGPYFKGKSSYTPGHTLGVRIDFFPIQSNAATPLGYLYLGKPVRVLKNDSFHCCLADSFGSFPFGNFPSRSQRLPNEKAKRVGRVGA